MKVWLIIIGLGLFWIDRLHKMLWKLTINRDGSLQTLRNNGPHFCHPRHSRFWHHFPIQFLLSAQHMGIPDPFLLSEGSMEIRKVVQFIHWAPLSKPLTSNYIWSSYTKPNYFRSRKREKGGIKPSQYPSNPLTYQTLLLSREFLLLLSAHNQKKDFNALCAFISFEIDEFK